MLIFDSFEAADVLELKEMLERWRRENCPTVEGEALFVGKYWQLGELQSWYAAFYTALTDYAQFTKQNYYEQKLASEEE